VRLEIYIPVTAGFHYDLFLIIISEAFRTICADEIEAPDIEAAPALDGVGVCLVFERNGGRVAIPDARRVWGSIDHIHLQSVFGLKKSAGVGDWFPGGLFLAFVSTTLILPSSLYILTLRGYQLSVYVRAWNRFPSERYRDRETNQGAKSPM